MFFKSLSATTQKGTSKVYTITNYKIIGLLTHAGISYHSEINNKGNID